MDVVACRLHNHIWSFRFLICLKYFLRKNIKGIFQNHKFVVSCCFRRSVLAESKWWLNFLPNLLNLKWSVDSSKFSALFWLILVLDKILGRQLSSFFVLAALFFCMLLKSSISHSWKCSFFQKNSENFFVSAFKRTVFISRWKLIEETFLDFLLSVFWIEIFQKTVIYLQMMIQTMITNN